VDVLESRDFVGRYIRACVRFFSNMAWTFLFPFGSVSCFSLSRLFYVVRLFCSLVLSEPF